MPAFIYRCPSTGYRVQGFVADDPEGDEYEAITCLVCRQIHLVNPRTGRLPGEEPQ